MEGQEHSLFPQAMSILARLRTSGVDAEERQENGWRTGAGEGAESVSSGACFPHRIGIRQQRPPQQSAHCRVHTGAGGSKQCGASRWTAVFREQKSETTAAGRREHHVDSPAIHMAHTHTTGTTTAPRGARQQENVRRRKRRGAQEDEKEEEEKKGLRVRHKQPSRGVPRSEHRAVCPRIRALAALLPPVRHTAVLPATADVLIAKRGGKGAQRREKKGGEGKEEEGKKGKKKLGAPLGSTLSSTRAVGAEQRFPNLQEGRDARQ